MHQPVFAGQHKALPTLRLCVRDSAAQQLPGKAAAAEANLALASGVTGAVVTQAGAGLDAAREQIDVLRARLRQDDANIQAAQAVAQQAEARAKAAEADASRAAAESSGLTPEQVRELSRGVMALFDAIEARDKTEG